MGPNKDWLVTMSQMLFTIAIVLMPFIGNLVVLWWLFFALGAAGGMLNVGM